MGKQEKAEAKIQRVIGRLPAADVDALVPESDVEYRAIAEAVMAWYQLLLASGILDVKDKRVIEVLSSSLLVLGTIVKYAYALGLRRGRRQAVGRRKKSG